MNFVWNWLILKETSGKVIIFYQYFLPINSCNKIFYRYAHYEQFKLKNETENFRLEIGGYQGNAGDSLNDPWYGSNSKPFSTYDKWDIIYSLT